MELKDFAHIQEVYSNLYLKGLVSEETYRDVSVMSSLMLLGIKETDFIYFSEHCHRLKSSLELIKKIKE